MALFTTPSGIQYHKLGSGPDIKVYMHGFEENPLNSQFFSRLYPTIKDKVTLYMGLVPGSSGWEKPWNGTSIGQDFLNFVVGENSGKRIFVSGFSAGADPDYIYGVKGITAFASVAGKSDDYKGFTAWVANAPPVYAFAGTADTSVNKWALCEKTWNQWYRNFGGADKLTWRPITGATHGAVAAFAYTPANGLWEWFNAQGVIPLPPPEPEKEKITEMYVLEQYLYVITDKATYKSALVKM